MSLVVSDRIVAFAGVAGAAPQLIAGSPVRGLATRVCKVGSCIPATMLDSREESRMGFAQQSRPEP